MLDKKTLGNNIAICRKRYGMTQKQLAELLHVTYQSVSRWELGLSFPSVEVLYDIGTILGVSADALLGKDVTEKKDINYKDAGLNTVKLYNIKEQLAEMITRDERILHGFCVEPLLFKMDTGGMKDPVYVLTTNVPGSKARLARERGYDREICRDLVARAVNSVVQFGAKPQICQAHVVCGNPNQEQMLAMGNALKETCESSGALFGSLEVSAQPVNFREGEYELSAALVGVVDREKVITGDRIREGDVVIGVETEGIDSTSFPFIKVMLDRNPFLAYARIGKDHYFLDEILRSNLAYAHFLEELREAVDVRGIIRVGNSLVSQGSYGNKIPQGLGVCIDFSSFPVKPLYRFIVERNLMDRSFLPYRFSLGIGMEFIVPPADCRKAMEIIEKYHSCHVIGKVKTDTEYPGEKVWAEGEISW